MADTTQAAGSGTHPAFKLESYENKALAHNKRLESLEDLIGHTITHAFDACTEKHNPSQFLLVTETGCWIVLKAEAGNWEDYYAEVKVATDHEYSYERNQRGRPELMSDFIDPEELFAAGLCGKGELKLLMDQKQAIEEKEKNEEVARLREQLSKLEGKVA